MAYLIDLDPVAEIQADGADAAELDLSDRRRPGRSTLPVELIPLLREPSEFDMMRDDAAPMRGIAIAVLLSAPIYLGLGLAVRWAFF